MRIYLYKSFLEKKPESSNQNIYFLEKFNYIALLIEKMSLNYLKNVNQYKKLREELKLKAKEITQENFLKILIKEDINVEKINFQHPIDEEDKEAIKSYLSEKQYKEIVQEIQNDEDYYLIDSIEIFLDEYNFYITLEKNLEININVKSFYDYTESDILNIFSNTNQISEILKEVEGV